MRWKAARRLTEREVQPIKEKRKTVFSFFIGRIRLRGREIGRWKTAVCKRFLRMQLMVRLHIFKLRAGVVFSDDLRVKKNEDNLVAFLRDVQIVHAKTEYDYAQH